MDLRETGQLRRATFPPLRAADRDPSGRIVVIANREPYAHEWCSNGTVVVDRPASGLVTALEPVLRSSGGTWIAYGGATADWAYADAEGRLPVPPDDPEYTLRRVPIDRETYDRYYSGFANEALWPLCHIAHTKPAFRAADWAAYQAVNESFARAAVEEADSDSLVLIQDYHFALVPRLMRNLAPDLATSVFWHIPWPNVEMFAICPWKEQLLHGLIGADIVGFHTRQYCMNFIDAVQRTIECTVDRDDLTVVYDGHRTVVRPYPISVEWPYPAEPRQSGIALRRSLGISPDAHVSLGVDRADYTKGLVERIAAVELLLEQNPSLAGRYVFVQIASPTRSRIPKYRELQDELNAAAARVNARFGTATWQPIVLQMRTFAPEEVRTYYAMADSAVVTPLHDGMNLVAKEYVASCTDADGVLVLSVFAGAARELEGALLVNPYDIEEVAQAMLRAVRMPVHERRGRMRAMRDYIARHSIADWSGSLMGDMREVRTRPSRQWPAATPVLEKREDAAAV